MAAEYSWRRDQLNAARERLLRNYVSVIIDKLGVDSRPQAIVTAREAGFR